MKSTDSIFKTMRYHGSPLAFNSLDQRFIITACMASLHLPPLSSLLIFLSIFPSATTGRTNFGLGSHDRHRIQNEFSIHSHAAIDDWNSNPTSHSSLGTFLVHPLWAGASVSFSIGFALGIIVFLLWHRTDLPLWHRTIKRRIFKPDPDKEPGAKPTLFSRIIRSIDDLSFLFDETTPPLQVIGRGACGEVYKAELLTGEQIISVAIKKIPQPSLMDASRLCKEESKVFDGRMRQIKSEIVTVGRMRHPHLVHLLAHVPKPEYHYLVYEYMPNGSLHDAIKNDEGRKKLSWPNRLKIAQGVAAGLEYLHMVHRPRIIHRDLKPANILLDENLNARIADFGMAKVVPEAISEAISSANVVGTLGYIAPEYYQTLHCTDKCDIYSFGVILAVLVTGIFPSDGFFQVSDEPSLVAWVRSMASSEESNEAIDPFLMGTGSEAEMILVLKIACFCTYDDPKARPNSKEVLRMLSQISL